MSTLLTGNIEVVATLLDDDAEATETIGDDAEVLDGGSLDGELATGHSGHADKAAYLNHVGEHGVLASMQLLHASDDEAVAGNAVNLGSHAAEHAA